MLTKTRTTGGSHLSTDARAPSSGRRERPVLLATLAAPLDPSATEFALGCAIEAEQLLVIAGFAQVPAGRGITLPAPELDAILQPAIDQVSAHPICAQVLKVRSPRPLKAILEVGRRTRRGSAGVWSRPGEAPPPTVSPRGEIPRPRGRLPGVAGRRRRRQGLTSGFGGRGSCRAWNHCATRCIHRASSAASHLPSPSTVSRRVSTTCCRGLENGIEWASWCGIRAARWARARCCWRAITAFYDRQRARGEDFFIYPDYFLFHVDGPFGNHSMLDVFPAHKEVVVADDAEVLLEAINDRGITWLLVEDREPATPELRRETVASARSRLAGALAYSPGGRVEGGDVRIAGNDVTESYVNGVLDPEGLIESIDDPEDPYAAALARRAAEVNPDQRARIRAERERLGEQGRPVETYRRLTIDQALASLGPSQP